MSTYEYTDSIGDKLRISSNGYGGATLVAEGKSSLRRKTILVEHEDVPTVATELLKAAGRADLAEYIEAAIEKEAESARIAEAVSPEGLTRCKLCNEGIAQAKAAREAAEKAEAEAAEKKLQERRDALASELSGDEILRYEHIRSSLRRAIDRIIELEDGASRD